MTSIDSLDVMTRHVGNWNPEAKKMGVSGSESGMLRL
jgi:hypothetical protein